MKIIQNKKQHTIPGSFHSEALEEVPAVGVFVHLSHDGGVLAERFARPQELADGLPLLFLHAPQVLLTRSRESSQPTPVDSSCICDVPLRSRDPAETTPSRNKATKTRRQCRSRRSA
ncbi:unnamed protein product [Ixodes persulcatus]